MVYNGFKDAKFDSKRECVVKMLYYKTIRRLREKHGLSHEEFAGMMGCTVDYVRSLEDKSEGREQATPEFVEKLRDKLNLHGIPLTDDERTVFYTKLNNLKHALDYGEYDKAADSIPELTRCAEASCYQGFINICDLYTAYYYYAINNIEAYENIMSTLFERMQTFDRRQLFYYTYFEGIHACASRSYNEALGAFIKAEELAKNSLWGDIGFYYVYGMVLSDMGYAAKAVKYHKKAKHIARWNKDYNGRANTRYDVYIDGYLADNLSKIGQKDEAFDILNKRLEFEKGNKSAKKVIGFLYLSMGKVYLRIGECQKADSYFNKAFKYLVKGSEAYNANLYYKALALITSGKISDSIDCVNKGLSKHIDDLWVTLFEVLKHSVSSSESKEYMENIIMPKLLKYGQHEEILRYYKAPIEIIANIV